MDYPKNKYILRDNKTCKMCSCLLEHTDKNEKFCNECLQMFGLSNDE